MTNNETRGRRRLGWLGLLMLLLVALGTCGYQLVSPSASTGPGKKPTSASSTEVLGPQAPGNTGDADPAEAAGTQAVSAPAASNSGNGGNSGSANCVGPSNGNGNCEKSFDVTVGQTQTLYPGLTRALPVTFGNPNNFDIFVTTYRVSVSSANATSCPASSLQVPSGTVTLSPRLTSPKNGSVTTTVPVKLSADAPEGCQQVSFTITVNASAVKK